MALVQVLREKLEKLKRCTNLYSIAPLMITSDGFHEHIDELVSIVNYNLSEPEFRLSLIYSDGRIFFDSAFQVDHHSGTHVFQSLELKEARINGSPNDLPQLAIENHMSRPEVFDALKHPSCFAHAERVSSTIISSAPVSLYVANATEAGPADTVCIRISMLRPLGIETRLSSKVSVKSSPPVTKTTSEVKANLGSEALVKEKVSKSDVKNKIARPTVPKK